MKLITAIIQNEVLTQVHQNLIDNGIERITVSRCTGHGRQQDIELYRGQEVTPSLIPKVRLEIACNDDFVEKAIEAILESACVDGGKAGDGKIFITTLDECIRIRTGERGTATI